MIRTRTEGYGSGAARLLFALGLAGPFLFLGVPGAPLAPPLVAAAIQDPEPPGQEPPEDPEPPGEQPEKQGGEQEGEQEEKGKTPPETPPGETPPGKQPPPGEEGEEGEETPPPAEGTPPAPSPTDPSAESGAAADAAGPPPAETATEATEPPEPPGPILPEIAPAYRSMGEMAGLLAQLATVAPDAAETFELGRTHDGRPVHGIQLGRPGAPPLAERPTVFLFGGLDGRSLAGGEAVLQIVRELLLRADELPPEVAFVAVPWVSGQALSWLAEKSATAPSRDGRNGRPLDDDRDGRTDEDGPDDLDGDGLILDMLIEDPAGPWARGGDGRFLVPAGPGDGTRYLWTREGRDDDGDGRFNEDPLGGVVLDRNFPVHRTGPWDDPRVGKVPMSEPLTRAVAELVLARRAAVVALVQGNHGCLATPGGLAPTPADGAFDPADRPVFERVTEAFLAATGRRQTGVLTLRAARGERSPGSALDWLHAVPGALSFEVAPWGPEVESPGDVAARDAFAAGPRTAALQKPRSLGDRAHLGDVAAAWARWLDNTRGGIGFVDWHPVPLGDGRQGLVGGWEPRTLTNPPIETLPRALEGFPSFVLELARGLPRLEVLVNQDERSGELLHLRAQVRNQGTLPTGMTRPGEAGVTLALELPPGAQLVAGELVVELPRLLGGELSAEAAWVLLAPEGSLFRLSASADWTGPVVREVVR